MTDEQIRAWKDPKFRAEMSADDKAGLPDNPAGQPIDEMSDDDLDSAAGGGLPTVSGGEYCTLTTECPILSVCCASQS